MSKFYEGFYHDLLPKSDEIYKNYNKLNEYKMTVKFNYFTGDIIANINNKVVFSVNDKSIQGNKIGVLSDEKGTIFTQILAE